jgi:subtilisin family serine protease
MNFTKVAPIAAAVLASLSFTQVASASERVILQVDNANKGIVTALTRQLGGQVKLEADGFISVEFTNKSFDELTGILKNPHIKLIEQDHIRRPMALFNDDAGNPMQDQLTPYAIYQSQANQVAFNPGTAPKVCIIDSGLDQSNPDFNWGSITGDNDSGTGNWNVNGGPHGTHVAGTIGAADNGIGVVGMAPGVPMHIVKVFNAEGWGYSSDLAYAAQKCKAAGAKIISMSLGGGGSNTTESNAFQSFVDGGGLVVAAAGNDGNNVRSYPAGYTSVMMVGANDANNAIADFSQFPSCTTGTGKQAKTDEKVCVEVTAGGVDTLSTYPAGMATSASLSTNAGAFATSAMENIGSASAATFFMGTAETVNVAANGKICMIDRGVISFHDKVKNCQNSGGVGAVIINNVAGMLYATLGEGAANTTSIPAVGGAFEDRAALLAATSATLSVLGSDYGYMSGTSMATPAVSGIAALVWSNHPSCKGEQIRSALKATAKDSGAAGKDVYFGYGIVQAKTASDYLTAQGCGATGGTAMTLSTRAYSSKGKRYVDLNWTNATTSNVDIYRNSVKVITTANDGAHTDALSSRGTYTYQVCEAGSTTKCTASKSVSL